MTEKKLHIGEIVERAFYQSGMNKADFARAIGVYRQNLNREFTNKDWSVMKLINAGKALHYDFSFLLHNEETEHVRSRVLLQIEVENNKVNEVLRLVGGNPKLVNILDKQ